MHIGVFAANMGPASHRDGARRFAVLAEELGYDSLWVGEHVVLPDPQVPPSPARPSERMVDPAVSLTFLGAHTERVLLATGIIILPQRNPVVLAKELASVDVLTGGRLVFGIGVGYLQPEFDAIGVPFDHKGSRTIEHLEAMQSLWYDDKPSYDGRFVRFAGVDAHPRPIQRPVPIVMGGATPQAWRRTVTHGHGWYGFALDLETTKQQLELMRVAQDGYERGAGLPDRIEITVSPRGRVDDDARAGFAAAGVDRLVLLPPPNLSIDEMESWLRDNAPRS
jgi:probable F420-dependent oxidoreductase